MRQRTFLWGFLSFLLGMAVAYGMVILDRKATVPRLESTDIFEVVDSDGNILRLSYAEIEREREELRDLRERNRGIPRTLVRRRGPGQTRPVPIPNLPKAEVPSRKAAVEKPPAKGLKDLFAKIFSQPIMQDLMRAQVARQTGELADVLDLTDEQRTTTIYTSQIILNQKMNRDEILVLPRGTTVIRG